MNKHISFTFLLLLLFITTAVAQRGTEQNKERVEAARVSFLTEKMKLTPDQAQKFWPVYNEYDAKRRDLKQKSRVFKNENLEALSDAQLRDGIQQMMDFRQKELELERSYVDKFLAVISPRQLATLYQSEKEFMRLLLKRMDEKRSAK